MTIARIAFLLIFSLLPNVLLACYGETNWEARVSTSDIQDAGTNARVFITIYGESGKTDDIELENPVINDFERGNTDTFRFTTVNVGKPYKMRVWHDNSGGGAGWHLDKIELENIEGNDTYSFICNCWMAVDDGDRALLREMQAETN